MADSTITVAITVALSAISLYCGMAVAGAQQDRESIGKLRGVAKALLADLDRIDDELTRMKETGLVPWTGKPPVGAPTIHPWVQGLIAQIADEATDVVAGFMRLERSLATLALTAERARKAHADLSQAYEQFQLLEEKRRGTFERGIYDPLTGHFIPPTESFEELPDDIRELTALSPVDTSLKSQYPAAAKIALIEARDDAGRALEDYTRQPNETMSILLALQERLYPIARRPVPTLPELVFKTTFPVPEDSELDELADRQALRELRASGRRLI